MSNFVNLHLHTMFSLNDSIIKPEDAANKAKSLGQQAIAMTDHGNIAGVVKFSDACNEAGIKPMLGMEAYITHEDPKAYNDDGELFVPSSAADLKEEVKKIESYHLTLLAKSRQGYKNLSYLSSMGHLYGFYSKPRIWLKDLFAHKEGLVVLTGCLGGFLAGSVSRLLGGQTDSQQSIVDYMQLMKKEFGDDFYVEVMNNGFDGMYGDKEVKEIDVANELMEIADSFGVKTVASCDAHYLNKEDKRAHDIFLCTNGLYYNSKEYTGRTGEGYIKSYEEMVECIGTEVPVTNTLEVAEKCNYCISKKDIDVPGLPGVANPQQELRNQAMAGIDKAWPDADKEHRQKLVDQIEYELKVIHDLGFDNYFLITWESVNWAKNHDVLVGDGRGSGASSRVARALDITSIDPEKYDLYFERFLNPDRKSAPDFDIDFPSSTQPKMFAHLVDLFGQDNVCRVATLQTMKPRFLAKRVFPALNIFNPRTKSWEEQYSNCRSHICAKYDEDITLNITELHEVVPELQEALKDDVYREDYYNTMVKMEGAKTAWSKHAGGVIVSKDSLIENHPLACQRSQGEYSIITQLDKDDAEHTGLLKLDFLGLKTLDIVDEAIRFINERHDNKINIREIDLEDSRVFRFLREGSMRNEVFQIGSSGMGNYIKQLKPDSISEISDMIALYRPGPLGAKGADGKNMVQSFIDRKHGIDDIELITPELGSVLKKTYGVIVYQEQIIKIARDLCGWTAAKADYLRYGVGKKKADIIAEIKPQFIADLAKNTGVSEDISSRIWSQIETFSRYGFNACLSPSTKLRIYDSEKIINKTIKSISGRENIVGQSFKNGNIVNDNLVEVIDSGEMDAFEIELSDGKKEIVSLEHKFMCTDNEMHTVEEIYNMGLDMLQVI